jgi:hypothetical protein
MDAEVSFACARKTREFELEMSRHADERLAAADESIRLGED